MHRGKGQHWLYPPDNPFPGRLFHWVSEFYQFVLQTMCYSFLLFISSSVTHLSSLSRYNATLGNQTNDFILGHIWKFLLYIFSTSLSILIKQETQLNISKIYSNFYKYLFLLPDSPLLLTSRKPLLQQGLPVLFSVCSLNNNVHFLLL